MARIICLANSWKHGQRCIAGIDPESGRWIRPVTGDTKDGSVGSCRLIAGREPALLDVLEIPIAGDGPDYGFESENRTILPGVWRKTGQVKPQDILRFVDRQPLLLHNSATSVEERFLRSLPKEKRCTLQLIECHEFGVEKEIGKETDRPKWRGRFKSADGRQLQGAVSITDPAYVTQLKLNHLPSNRCLITLSLGLPFVKQEGAPPRCYKLIAGVVEL